MLAGMHLDALVRPGSQHPSLELCNRRSEEERPMANRSYRQQLGIGHACQATTIRVRAVRSDIAHHSIGCSRRRRPQFAPPESSTEVPTDQGTPDQLGYRELHPSVLSKPQRSKSTPGMTRRSGIKVGRPRLRPGPDRVFRSHHPDSVRIRALASRHIGRCGALGTPDGVPKVLHRLSEAIRKGGRGHL